MSYKPPIEIAMEDVVIEDVVKKFNDDLETAIVTHVTEKCHIHVDTDELFKALKYDRGQYQLGYFQGYMACLDARIFCNDCKHHHDGTQCYKRIGIWFNDDYCSGAERKETQDD